jgi:PAS domain-containing protein
LLLGALALSYWGTLAAHIAKTGRDIRERQKSELALAERNAQMTLAGTAALVGSYSYDVDSDNMQVSAGYAAIHGLPEGTTETTRREWRNRVHPDEVGPLVGLGGHAFGELGRENNAEYRIVLPDRGVRWIESRSSIPYHGDGNARRVVGVDIDVTSRKLAELALAERNTQLELASKSARVGSFSVDFSTSTVRLTAGCAAIYGLPEGTIETSCDDLRKLVHPEDLPELEALRDQMLNSQQREFTTQFRIVRANDGVVSWLEMRSLV